MKNALERIGTIVLGIIGTPLFMVGGIVRGWRLLMDDPALGESIANLLLYGKRSFGMINEGIVVCKRIGDNIWSKDGPVSVLTIPQAIKRMRVSTWDIKDGKLWIKVVINDRLIGELEKELEEVANNETQEKLGNLFAMCEVGLQNKKLAEEEQMRIEDQT